MDRLFDVLTIWRDWADDVAAKPIEAGHFLAEENPSAVLAALTPFLLPDTPQVPDEISTPLQ